MFWGVKSRARPSFKKRVADAKYVVPDGVERIADGAFAVGDALIAVELPETLQIIGEEAFTNSALRSIKLNEGLAEIDDNAFEGARFYWKVIPRSLQTFNYQRIDADEFYVAPEHPTLRAIDGVLVTPTERRYYVILYVKTKRPTAFPTAPKLSAPTRFTNATR